MKTPKYFDKPTLEERVPKIMCIKCNQMHFLYEKLNASLQQIISNLASGLLSRHESSRLEWPVHKTLN